MAEHKLNPKIMGWPVTCITLGTQMMQSSITKHVHRQPSRFGPVSLTPVPVTGTGTGNFCVLIFR